MGMTATFSFEILSVENPLLSGFLHPGTSWFWPRTGLVRSLIILTEQFSGGHGSFLALLLLVRVGLVRSLYLFASIFLYSSSWRVVIFSEFDEELFQSTSSSGFS